MHSQKRTRNSRKNKRSLHNQIIQRGGDLIATVQILNYDGSRFEIGSCNGLDGVELDPRIGIRNENVKKFNFVLLQYINYSLINKSGLNSINSIGAKRDKGIYHKKSDLPFILERISIADINLCIFYVENIGNCIYLYAIQFTSIRVRKLCILINKQKDACKELKIDKIKEDFDDKFEHLKEKTEASPAKGHYLFTEEEMSNLDFKYGNVIPFGLIQ